jgi:molybdenum cofactor cytidylyltransferase
MTLVAIVLAAGRATRFGSDKMSADLNGVPLLHHAIRAARAAPVERVIVVTRPGVDAGEWSYAPAVEVIRLTSEALSDSLRAGIAAAGQAERIGDNYAALPVFHGRAGHPVLLSARAFPDICALSGDEGAGRLLKARADIMRVHCEDPAVQLDIDRPEDLATLRAG